MVNCGGIPGESFSDTFEQWPPGDYDSAGNLRRFGRDCVKQQHTRIISTVFAAGGLLAVSASGALAAPADNGDSTRVFVCHATGADGYERVGVSLQEAVDSHAGHADDIIPPFDYSEGKTFAGQNYDGDGRDIWNNGCNDPNEDQTSDDEAEDDTDEATPPADGSEDADAQKPEVVQTDGTVAEDNSMLAALGIGMLFAGGATLVAVGAGVTGRRD